MFLYKYKILKKYSLCFWSIYLYFWKFYFFKNYFFIFKCFY